MIPGNPSPVLECKTMLAIHDVSKTYDNGVHALRDVNLDIPRGAFGLQAGIFDRLSRGHRRGQCE